MIVRHFIQVSSHLNDTQNKGSASMDLRVYVYKMGMWRHKFI